MPVKRKKTKKVQLPHLNRVIEFRESLTPETDRGCGVAAPAFIDEELKFLLQSVLADDDKLIEQAFSQSGPLASFSARIDFGFLMGLLSRVAWRDLHIIRKVRNDFAHSAKPLSFDDDAIRSRCSELSHSGREKSASPRQHFTSAVCGVLACIHGSLSSAKRPVVPPDLLSSDQENAALRNIVQKTFDEFKSSLSSNFVPSKQAKVILQKKLMSKLLDKL
jgi:DNA-binding MltR family transcriptional regulator